jgi:hypothetical protein
MPIKLRKTYTSGPAREELTTVIELGPSMNLTQDSSGLPLLDVVGTGAILSLGTPASTTPNFSSTAINSLTIPAGATACTIYFPTGVQASGQYVLLVKQNGTGAGSLIWSGANFRWPGGTGPQPSATANSTLMVRFLSDGTLLFGQGTADFR